MADIKESVLGFISKMDNYNIPKWEELPELELYMDQVVVLINKYLGGFGMSSLTSSMINNYVKLKAVPAPHKKRYNRIHLAYLLMICSLKYTLSIPQIQKIIPIYETEEEVRCLYNNFFLNHKKTIDYLSGQFKAAFEVCDDEYGLIVRAALSSGFAKLFTEDYLKSF